MLSDPISVTYDGVTSTLPRTGQNADATSYTSPADGLEVVISGHRPRNGDHVVEFTLTHVLPDPTPADVFDPYRRVGASCTLAYRFDSSRPTEERLAKLRTAVLAFLTPAIEARLIGGEQ